jgi:hypothetical protein
MSSLARFATWPKRLCGKLLSTQLTGLPADRPPRWRLDLEAKLDQAAESI